MLTTDPSPAHDKPKGGRLAQLGEGILHALVDLNGVLASLRAFLADTTPKRKLPGRRSGPVLTASLRAQRVRTARQAQGMSIGELARRVGATADTVARYERGTSTFSKFERQILHVLGLREDDLAADAES